MSYITKWLKENCWLATLRWYRCMEVVPHWFSLLLSYKVQGCPDLNSRISCNFLLKPFMCVGHFFMFLYMIHNFVVENLDTLNNVETNFWPAQGNCCNIFCVYLFRYLLAWCNSVKSISLALCSHWGLCSDFIFTFLKLWLATHRYHIGLSGSQLGQFCPAGNTWKCVETLLVVCSVKVEKVWYSLLARQQMVRVYA